MKTKKKSISNIILFVCIVMLPLYLIYGVIIPNKMEDDVSGMKMYLNDLGYSNISVKNKSSLSYTVTFNTDRGDVKVRYSKNGLFQKVY